jgi:hypothetical protein
MIAENTVSVFAGTEHDRVRVGDADRERRDVRGTVLVHVALEVRARVDDRHAIERAPRDRLGGVGGDRGSRRKSLTAAW